MRTYIFRPAATGRYPGIVLFSEIFQVTGPVRPAAAQLAGSSFVVAVPEVYHEREPPGTVLPYDAAGAERGNAHKVTKTVASFDADARAAVDYFMNDSGCTGALGVVDICLGGHLAFRAAMNPDVRAGACFYATDLHTGHLGLDSNDDRLERAGEIGGELLMVWGRQDPHVSREGRELIYETLNDAEVTHQWYEFNAAHAFLRDEGPRYDPALARIWWGMVLELFQRTLGVKN